MARAAKQRERILDAAEVCFIQHGFHAASMAHIAQTAEMSAGLIYRYFDGKAAIVKAIIERHLESEHYKKIGQLHSAEDVCRSILETFDAWRRREDPKMNPVLMIELAAESTRDPEIARAVRTKDRAFEPSITALVRRIASQPRRQADPGRGAQPRHGAAVPGRGPGDARSARSETAARHAQARARGRRRRPHELIRAVARAGADSTGTPRTAGTICPGSRTAPPIASGCRRSCCSRRR